MPKIKINKAEFNEWADSTWVVYASETIDVGRDPHDPKYRRRRLLRLKVNVAGLLCVEFGDKILYRGHDLTLAKNAYSAANNKVVSP